MSNSNIELRRTVHGGDDSALSIEVSAIRFNPDSVSVVHEGDADADGFGVYIRNPLAFHIQDFGLETTDPERRVTLDEAKAAAFTFAGGLADHLGCSIDSTLTRPLSVVEKRAADYQASLERDGARLCKANGFAEEQSGGGCTVLSRRWPNGAHIWATGGDGFGNPALNEFLVCVYATDPDGQLSESLLDLRHDTDDGIFLPRALSMALNAARYVDERLARAGVVTAAALADIAGDAARAVADPPELAPEGFRRWTDGIAQGAHVYIREGVGCIILSDLFGQEYATAESWSLSVFTGEFDFDGDGDGGATLQPVHLIEMESGLPFDAALAVAIATLNALPAPAAPAA